jgi:glutamate dehydrogenase/leucine dehydrogenase
MFYNESLKSLLDKFQNKQPEIVFEWKDSETEAEGWVVINSLRGDASGGGTRMRKGLDRYEVESLAKTMEVKFSVSGPAIGGAKSGINFDPRDPRKRGVLERWYKAIAPLLNQYYGTGGDLNVDEIHEVIPITQANGVPHPQACVVKSHLKITDPVEQKRRVDNLVNGVTKVLDDERFSPDITKPYTVSDMITGWGVAEGIRHFYHLYGGVLSYKTAIIQGFGNVAAAAAYYLAQNGVKIVGIIDRVGGLIKKEGFTFDEIKELFANRNGNALNAPNMLSFDEVNEQIWKLKAEIYIPGAASRLISKENMDDLIEGGLEVMSCGANVPFADKEIFMGPIAQYADEHTAVVADFIANCGMARTFAYLMTEHAQLTDEAIFHDASKIIYDAMAKIHQFNPKPTGLMGKGLEIELIKLTQ